MKLKEYIEKIDDTTRLYLSSRSAFFYIGTKDNLKLLPSIEKDYKNRFKTKIESNKEQIKTLEQNLKIICKKLERKPESQELITERKMAEFKIKKCNQSISLYTKALENYKPILERKIKVKLDGDLDIYKKTTMPDELGIAIYIEGYENGDYWTYKEWIKEHDSK